MMKRSDTEFKICAATLFALVITIMVQRFVYSGFVWAKAGRCVYYDFGLWQAYWEWLPGKILCIINAILIIAFIAECCLMICKKGK